MDELKINQYIIFALIGLTIWVLILSYFLFKAISHYRRLGKSENIKDLGKILERIVSRVDLQAQEITEIKKGLVSHKDLALGHFSKHALIRFNPFEESGGDQSFTIALLDSKNNGIVLSSLHSRSGTRIYAKEVVGAGAPHHKLSKEEKEAVDKAARQV
ncbi:hypothetical protein A3A54_02330 [Candidatus Curtissbacteria bacterium RIFCSPLOWO2_01_FULL_39_62]|uniref:DUF4446 domain-containing protein n=2 Tax=Candidatus Curtissiibacteriota TaxID=1752717 RepID=A0A1F5G8U9_9BACT|nr:MAG: hypothetical protein A2775_02730 [Candidatus Curtissbacteria bacterium RIFCSPHIGHO2_01_FULL_39_57]OGD88286.1 MAG: hypothetical protein A3D04_00705 [Candidatus Curtissbacteria bacterium RIFCSPHIGHO2_02_FULL_40_16b]OGD90350.1 MAG: hypothetical protein A3E11_00715 [Candidatus Curtissbacteria bacterium RIFCSPHIGHO2_12_FULL_38_37]OGE00074.1 MAG: hypothetical protein A3J17_05310 [Candidatus Curtissbacteria bacterium RIFCSPLOWO2_02_FULL_40_11]OGE00588.1 MAG: hypothetical protein A3A54_02330 [C